MKILNGTSTLGDIRLKREKHESSDALSAGAYWSRADGQLSAQLFHSLSDLSYPPHAHSDYVITVCIRGRIISLHGNHTDTATPGETLVTTPGITHAAQFERRTSLGFEAISVVFDRRLLRAMGPELSLPATEESTGFIFTGAFHDLTIQTCAEDMARELRQRGTGHRIVIEALAIRLLAETLRGWPRDRVAAVPCDNIARLSPRDFVRAYEFMRSCRKEAFRLERLCGFLGSSEENFTRLFSASTNVPPASFYNQMLLQRGRDLLHTSALSIKEIGFELGFKTTSHFIVAFRRAFDLSPQKYRAQANLFT